MFRSFYIRPGPIIQRYKVDLQFQSRLYFYTVKIVIDLGEIFGMRFTYLKIWYLSNWLNFEIKQEWLRPVSRTVKRGNILKIVENNDEIFLKAKELLCNWKQNTYLKIWRGFWTDVEKNVCFYCWLTVELVLGGGQMDGWMYVWMDGWMDGWMKIEAV
jgi:hypothetical protein